jgi:hypothetical protein
MNAAGADEKRREEDKRNTVLGPAGRWQTILQAITWAEAQPQIQRNTPAKCLKLQQAKLAAEASVPPTPLVLNRVHAV